MPVPPVAPRSAATTRRTALGGVLASLAAVSACDLDRPDDAPSSPAGSRASSAQATPDGDPDGALVDEVLAELAELTALVTGVGARFPALAAPMRALGDLHDAHREALDAGSDTGPDTEPSTGPVTRRSPTAADARPADALRRVRSRERVAQRRLADWAVAARSGALARLLACMSAGVAQQLVVLPATAGRRDR